jgi:osmoprotectant transport system permease protein
MAQERAGVSFIAAVLAWLSDPAHWQGSDGIPVRLLEHVELSAAALLVAGAIALPLGSLIGHTGRGALVAINLANVGRAIPSIAILGLALPFTIQVFHQLEFWPTFITLVVLGVPPILTNAYVGIRDVDPELMEAARGMGMNALQLLWGVELPIALPVIVAGVRTAALQIVATATLGAWVAEGGLGRYIFDGLDRQEYDRMFVGALLVIVVALTVDALFGVLERRLTSPGVRPYIRELGVGEVAGATSR